MPRHRGCRHPATLGGAPSLPVASMAPVRVHQKYRMRAPSSGREVIIEAEPGQVYVDRDTGEELEVALERTGLGLLIALADEVVDEHLR